jgi:hypothetical protein
MHFVDSHNSLLSSATIVQEALSRITTSIAVPPFVVATEFCPIDSRKSQGGYVCPAKDTIDMAGKKGRRSVVIPRQL